MASPTSHDPVKKTGVSVATLSCILNGSPLVTESAQRMGLRAVKGLYYQPIRAAQCLHAGRSHVIGLIISDIQSPFFTPVMLGSEDFVHQNSYLLALCNSEKVPIRNNSTST